MKSALLPSKKIFEYIVFQILAFVFSFLSLISLALAKPLMPILAFTLALIYIKLNHKLNIIKLIALVVLSLIFAAACGPELVFLVFAYAALAFTVLNIEYFTKRSFTIALALSLLFFTQTYFNIKEIAPQTPIPVQENTAIAVAAIFATIVFSLALLAKIELFTEKK